MPVDLLAFFRTESMAAETAVVAVRASSVSKMIIITDRCADVPVFVDSFWHQHYSESYDEFQ